MVKDLHAENYKALIKINADDSNRKISYAQDERIDTVKMAILLRAIYRFNLQFSSVIQSWLTLCNPSLSITNSMSLLKLMSIE